MRVVTWNMGCGSPRFTGRYRKAHDEAWRLLVELEPDVVLVQEALLDVPAWLHDAGAVIAQERHYDKQDSGCVVLLRRALVGRREVLEVDGSYISAAEVSTSNGPMLTVSVHVDTKDQRRNLEHLVDRLSSLTEGRSFVVGGDFNACRRWDQVYKRNVFSWFFDRLAERGFHDCHFGLHEREDQSFWGHQTKEAYQLDHFFIERSARSRVVGCAVATNAETKRLSDHSPLILDLDLG